MNDESHYLRGNFCLRARIRLAAAALCVAAAISCQARPTPRPPLSLIHHSSLLLHRFPSLPPDVKTGHWAAPFVQEILANNVLALPDGREFHGEAKVTHGEALGALARLAQILEAGKWQAMPSRPVSDSIVKPLLHGDWRTQKVTRYEMAKALASMGDYVANGLPRPAPEAKNLGKSEVMPAKATIKIAKSNPAYADLLYLVNARMIAPDSPLLKADDKPLRGGEMSRALADVVIGLNNRMTDLNLEEDGSTPDKSFHKQPPKKSDTKNDARNDTKSNRKNRSQAAG